MLVSGALVGIEALLLLAFPAAIGLAIDGLLANEFAWLLVLLCVLTLSVIIPSVRRLYDARLYAAMFESAATDLADRRRDARAEISATSARVGLLEELTESLQTAIPVLLMGAIGIVGSLVILWGIDPKIFALAVGLLVLAAATFALTARHNIALNAALNDEYERQVSALGADKQTADRHFRLLMRFDIRVSDLGTLNAGVISLGAAGLLIAALVILVDGASEVGVIVSGVLYVASYIDLVEVLPDYVTQVFRLREIGNRLNDVGG